MGLAGATAGALSGVVVEHWGYPTLAGLAALAAVPLVVMLAGELRGRAAPPPPPPAPHHIVT
jgi:hypothetical protein